MPLVVTDKCANCRDCLPVCPVDCFFEDEEASRVYINPRECIGCLCCYLVCPHDAIYPLDQVPQAKAAWIAVNDQRSNAPGARRLHSSGLRHATPAVVQGRSAATASRGQQRMGRGAPDWWSKPPQRRPPTPSYDASAGRDAGGTPEAPSVHPKRK